MKSKRLIGIVKKMNVGLKERATVQVHRHGTNEVQMADRS